MSHHIDVKYIKLGIAFLKESQNHYMSFGGAPVECLVWTLKYLLSSTAQFPYGHGKESTWNAGETIELDPQGVILKKGNCFTHPGILPENSRNQRTMGSRVRQDWATLTSTAQYIEQ